MNSSDSRYKQPFWKWPALYVLVVCVLIVWLLPRWAVDPLRVEEHYTHGFWVRWSAGWGVMLDAVPFSFGDVGYVLLLVFLGASVYQIGKRLIQRQFRHAVYRAVICLAVLSGLYVYFQWSWGLNYFRLPLMQQVSYPSVPMHLSNVVEVLEFHLHEANRWREAAVQQNDTLTFQEIGREADRLALQDTSLTGVLVGKHAKSKASLFGRVSSWMGVSGYFNPFTQEAQINTHQPKLTLAFTACHELAHQMGVGFEDEANLIGYVLATQSDSPSFQYAAHFSVFWMLMNELYSHSPELYMDYLQRLPPGLREDTAAIQAYWEQHTGWLQSLSTFFYTLFLKANQQPEGMERYNRMVDLLLSWHFRHHSCV